MPRSIISLTLLPLMAACATANPPTVTGTDVLRAYDEAERIGNLPITQREDAPSNGFVTYDGRIGADLRDGDTNRDRGSMLADMSMTVDFVTNDIGGRIDNVNLIDTNGEPDQRLDGRLIIAGRENLGDIDAAAQGELSGVTPDGFGATSDFFLDLDGALYNDEATADAVYGDVTGAADGGFDLTIDGVFFGTER